ncbi:MAG: esterase, partial [Chitinophagaceae bacterium]
MNMKSLSIFLLIQAISVCCYAQPAMPPIIEDFKPSTCNQPGQLYPMVNSQGYARFKI